MLNGLQEQNFDYVVVGAGSAGAVVAARLSEDPSLRVALIEAGPRDEGIDEVLTLNRWMELLESGYDWDYPVEEQENGNSFMRMARAKVLGGCSSHNSCIAFWAPAEDIDEWESKFGAAGWNAETAFRIYRKIENNADDGEHHGHDGPVRLRSVPPADPCGVALLDAAEAAGIPPASFNAGKTVTQGANFLQINATEDGKRASSSVSYLHPAADRENLVILDSTHATGLVFDDSKRCIGVQVVDNAFSAPRTIRASREVIVSAGAIDSPKLLMLSGIGPAEHLASVGVEVLVDAPGVGANLQDHPEAVIQWQAKKPMVTESTQWWEIGVFAQIDEGLDRPDLMMHYGTVNFDMHTFRQDYPTADNVFCLTPNVTHARSRGTVRLRSRDYRDKPRVDPRYFTDPEGYDLRIMTAGLRKAREIVSQAPLAEWAGEELFPGAEVQTDEQIQDYIRRTHNTVYHPAGTVRMGAADDETSPLDPELRVKGVTGLRVADASVMPELVTVNPNVTVYMIGERAAELIAGEYKTTSVTEETVPATV